MIRTRLRSEWPLVAMMAFWAIYLVLQGIAMRGAVSYASDDAYLRIAIGQNLAWNGTWGINAGQFASIVGSLAWPFLLGILDKLFGVRVWMPLLFNILLSLIFIVVLDRAARRVLSERWLRFSAMLLATVMLPLGALVLEGMEHTLQLLLTLVVVEGALRIAEENRSGWAWWMGASVLLAVTRYEGLFVLGMAAILLVYVSHKNASMAIGMLTAAAVPVILYGWMSARNGWLPVPNDVYFRRAPLVLGGLGGVWSVFLRPLESLTQSASLRAILLAPLIAIFWRVMERKQNSAAEQAWLRTLLFGGVVLLHLYFVGLREYRYDAYLLLLGWWAVLPWLQEIFDFFREERLPILSVSGAVFGILGVLLLFPLVNRGVSETVNWWNAREAFRQNQSAAVAFFQENIPSSGVATDFPGIFSYAGFPVVDLTGMGSLSLSRARRSGGIQADVVASEVAIGQIRNAFVRDPSVQAYLPLNWIQSSAFGAPTVSDTTEIILYEIPAQ